MLALWPSFSSKAATETKLVIRMTEGDSVAFSLSKLPTVKFTNESLVVESQSFSKSLSDVLSLKFFPYDVPDAGSGVIVPSTTIPVGADYVPEVPVYDQTPKYVPFPASLDMATVTLSQTQFEYTGSALKPSVTVSNGTEVLEEGVDYTVAYSNNVNPGEATVTITGKGIYSGSTSATFTITMPVTFVATVNGQTVEPELEEFPEATMATYTTPEGVVYLSNCKALGGSTVRVWLQPAEGYWTTKDSIDVELSGYNPIDLSTLSSFTFLMPASGKVTMNVNFYERADISQANLTLGTAYFTEEGTPVVPTITLTYNGRVLEADRDYSVEITDNDTPGTAHLKLTGLSRYKGTINTTFAVEPFYTDLVASSTQLTIAGDSFVYTGQPITPAYTLMFENQELTDGVDYTAQYTDNVNAGTANLKLTGKGKYRGTVDASFVIEKAMLTVKADTLTKVYGDEMPELTYQVTGFVKGEDTTILTKQPVAVTEALSDSPVATYPITVGGGEAMNYEFTYEDAILTVTQKNLETAALTFTEDSYVYTGAPITPAFLLQLGNAELTTADYQAEYENNVNAGSGKLTINGIGNYTGSTMAEFAINKAMLTIKADSLTKVYGDELPELTFQVTGFVNDEDTTVLAQQPVANTEATSMSNVGEYAIVVSGGEAGNYDFTYVNAGLVIEPKDISTAELTLAPDSVAYAGKPVLPEMAVQIGSTALIEDSDYIITGSNNTEPGIATLTIDGQGNYVGRIDTTFVIYLKPTVEVAINDSAVVGPVIDDKNKAEFVTRYGKVVISDYYALPGSTVTLAVTPAEAWLLSSDSIEVSEPVEVMLNQPTSYVGFYVVPEDGIVSVSVNFSVDSVYVGIKDRLTDALRFEMVDGQTVCVLGADEAAPVSVFDARGQQVAAEVVRSYRELIVRLARLPQGLYIIRVNNKSFKVYRK